MSSFRAEDDSRTVEDIEWLNPDRGATDVAARWSGLGPGLVIVTDGAHGASAYRATRRPVHRPGRRVAVVDTIGAGDAFTGGLLTGLIRRRLHGGGRLAEVSDETLVRIIDNAVLISAVTLSARGGSSAARGASAPNWTGPSDRSCSTILTAAVRKRTTGLEPATFGLGIRRLQCFSGR
jgi:sugar/nucleoside kinase (ribokinase family)